MFVPCHHHHRAQRNRGRIALLRPLLLAFVIGGSAWAHAQQHAPQGNCTHPDPATRPDCPGAIAFLAKFQDALKSNDHEAVAMLVNYPLRATPHNIRSRAQLLANFDRIFNPQVRTAILAATPDDVWGNYRGFMIGRGVIWFDSIIPSNAHPNPSAPDSWKKYPFKVITVNPPIP
jgi:hypothetical protein